MTQNEQIKHEEYCSFIRLGNDFVCDCTSFQPIESKSNAEIQNEILEEHYDELKQKQRSSSISLATSKGGALTPTEIDLNNKNNWFVERNDGIRQICSSNNTGFCITNLTKEVAFAIVDEHNKALSEQAEDITYWKSIADIQCEKSIKYFNKFSIAKEKIKELKTEKVNLMNDLSDVMDINSNYEREISKLKQQLAEWKQEAGYQALRANNIEKHYKKLKGAK